MEEGATTNTPSIRAARWPEDIRALSRLDTSFTTDTIYRAVCGELSFALVEERLATPLVKSYALDIAIETDRGTWSFAAVAEVGHTVVGFVAARLSEWNGRLEIDQLHVAPTHRRQGIGTRLLDAAEAHARSVGARSLWLETQNVNFPAIAFYRAAGFELCGLDRTLYDPRGPWGTEVALYFSRPLAQPAEEARDRRGPRKDNGYAAGN